MSLDSDKIAALQADPLMPLRTMVMEQGMLALLGRPAAPRMPPQRPAKPMKSRPAIKLRQLQ